MPPPVRPDIDPLLVPAARLEIASGILTEAGDVDLTRCFVGRFMAQVTVDQLTAMGPELEALSVSVAQECLAGG